jgi:hypothetical protein
MRLLAAFAAAVVLLSAADSKLGKPLALKKPVAIAAVCQEMGCWMYLADDPGRAAKKRRLDPRRGARG